MIFKIDSLLVFFVNFILIVFLLKILSFYKFEKLIDKNFKKPQSFHYQPSLRIGGIVLMFSLIFFYVISKKSVFYDVVIIFGIFFFFLGLLSDMNTFFNPLIRFIIMFFFTFFFVFIFDLKILDIQLYQLNLILNNYKIVMILFVVLSIIFIVNGSNFIDGFNGLLLIHFIIILSIFSYLNFKYYNSEIFLLCIFLIFSSTLILKYNFPLAKIFLGDNGSYLVGSIISLIAIQTSTLNNKYPPFFFACIFFYLFFEVFFSFFRKLLILKKNPLYPDKYHLHMLVYSFLIKKKFSKFKSNYLCGFFINLVYIILISPTLFLFNSSPNFLKLYFFALIIIYNLIYFYFYSYYAKRNQSV